MASRVSRLHIIAAAVQVYQVIKAQRQHLPNQYFPLGCQQSTSFSSIEYFDGYVQVGCKKVTRLLVPYKWRPP